MDWPTEIKLDGHEVADVLAILSELDRREVIAVPPERGSSMGPQTHLDVRTNVAKLKQLLRRDLERQDKNGTTLALTLSRDEAVFLLQLLESMSGKGVLCLTASDWELDIRGNSVESATPYVDLLIARLSPEVSPGDTVRLSESAATRDDTDAGTVAHLELSPNDGWTVWIDWPGRGVEGYPISAIEVMT